MTRSEEQGETANGQTVYNDVVVVAADAGRLGQYEDALRKVQVPARSILNSVPVWFLLVLSADPAGGRYEP